MKKIDESKIEDILSRLTLEEKIGMIHGDGLFKTKDVKRLGIPALKMSDGPLGVRNEFENAEWKSIGLTDDFVTYLPSHSALAATWNRNLAYLNGQVLGEEARGRGKDIILAPGVNIKRSPLCGRNFEYMSEDPKLIEEMVVPLIKGIQESDVAACVKHYALNNQETNRLWVDVEVDDRALREIYLPGFKAAVEKGNAYSLMGAYNLYHGIHCCHSKELLDDILRKEWGYDGTVISDWGAVHDTKLAAEASLDIEMSVFYNFDDYFFANPLLEAVREGKIKEHYIDSKVKNILRMMYRLNMLEGAKRVSGAYNTPEHRNAVLEIARESIVVLKNEEKRLPLVINGFKKIAVIGVNGEIIHSNGGGSAEIKALYEISPLMGIKKALGGNVEVCYSKGYYVPTKEEDSNINWQESSLDNKADNDVKELTQEEIVNLNELKAAAKEKVLNYRNQLLQEAVALSKEVDEVIIVGGLNHDYDSEGLDRDDMTLPYGQDELIQAILEVKSDAVIVMVAGSPVDMSKWSQKAKAIVWNYYAGMETGTALADVLLGKVNPSGKLPETFPVKITDCSAHSIGDFPGVDIEQKDPMDATSKVKYDEGIYVGYRHVESKNIAPLFCFGHGCSYTSFEYRMGKINVNEDNEQVKVYVKLFVKNTGDRAGSETVQLYVSDKEASVDRPVQELKGFSKVYLEKNEEQEIEVILSKDAFGFYDVKQQSFCVEKGEFELRIGSSSQDIRIKQTIELSKDYLY